MRCMYLIGVMRNMEVIDLTQDPIGAPECAICLEDVTTAFWTGCHLFCRPCISEWVRLHPACPTCKTEIPEAIALLPRKSRRVSRPTRMFTMDWDSAFTETSQEMMQRVEEIDHSSYV